MVEKRKKSYYDSSSSGGGRRKGVDYGGVGKSRFELEEDEAHLPISLLRLKYQEVSDEPIRLQGKNGVLKVMVNKKKKMGAGGGVNVDLGVGRKGYDSRDEETRKGSRSEDVVAKGNVLARPSFYSESKRVEKRSLFVERDKSEPKLQKTLLGKCSKVEDSCSQGEESESDGADTVLKLAPPSAHAGSSKKRIKKEEKGLVSPSSQVGNTMKRFSKEEKILALPSFRTGSSVKEAKKEKEKEKERATPTRNVTPVKAKDAKIKRGGSTEKQQLRERIRKMLLESGWTIDYRPRRNRDYLDAVYINPSGTAYWSIIKAYDALQKQLEDENDRKKSEGPSSSFAPLPEDLLNKLTRQTRKKIEKEMKKKRRDDRMSKNSKQASLKEDPENDTDSDRDEEKLSSYVRQNSKLLKSRLPESEHGSGDESSDNPCKDSPKQERKYSRRAKSHATQGRTSSKIGRCTLLIRSSGKGQNSDGDDYVPYTGKRTLLAWLIDSETVELSQKVQYMNRRRTRVKLEGWITKDGIHCGCCSKILTVSKFELHAGSKLRQPFQNICLESGVSLLQCLTDAWNRQDESERKDFCTVDTDGDDPDDDTCGICGDGGELICCDSCPSTFHQSCLDIQMVPADDWHCPNCTCKFCGDTKASMSEENNGTVDELLTCSLCEKRYHKSCCDGKVALPANSTNASVSFCTKKCLELNDHLQKILGVKHELEGGFSWSLIQRSVLDSDTSLRGHPQRVECNSKLAVALSVMDECFLPIIDRRSGINLIHNVLYNCGSNFKRLNFRGFYTAILERGDEIISAASIRIHGTQLAEMPFIGTRHIYRRQGMCRRLLTAIELLLCSLKVEKLVIPAIAEHMQTWTGVFGFDKIEASYKKEMKSMNMLVFPGTDMLLKLVVKQDNLEGLKAESKENEPQSPAALKPDVEISATRDEDEHGDTGSDHKHDIDVKADPHNSTSPASAAPSNENGATSATDTSNESDIQLSSEETTSPKPHVVNKLDDTVASDILDVGDPPRPPAKESTRSSAENTRDNACKIAAESTEDSASKMNVASGCLGSVMDSSGETPFKDISDMINENQNPESVSTVSGCDEIVEQGNHGLNDNAVKITSKLCSSEICSDAEAAHAEVDIHSVKGSDLFGPQVIMRDLCVEPKAGSLENSAQSTTENVNTEHHSVSVSAPSVSGDPAIQFNPDLNRPDAMDVESEPCMSSDFSDVKEVVDAKSCLATAKVELSAACSTCADNSSKIEASVSRPAHNITGESCPQNSAENNANQEPHAASLIQPSTKAVEYNSDKGNQNISKQAGASPAALEVGLTAEVVIEKNSPSSATSDIDDTEVETGHTSTGPVLDSLFETSGRHTSDVIDEKKESVSTPDEMVGANLNEQIVADAETEPLIASGEADDDVTTASKPIIQFERVGTVVVPPEAHAKPASPGLINESPSNSSPLNTTNS